MSHDDYEDYDGEDYDEEPVDQWEEDAVDALTKFFEDNPEKVFFFRQIEVYHEDTFYHWVTNRALHRIIGTVVRTDERKLSYGVPIKFAWHKSLRYFEREIKKTVKLVEEYSDPNVGASLGLNAELLVLEAFARHQFLCVGRNANSFGSNKWSNSDHNLDFIFSKDSIAYGVEVKNQLRYPDYEEMDTKVKLCKDLGIKPLFIVRMLPKHWIYGLKQKNGFALILNTNSTPSVIRLLLARCDGAWITS